MARFVPALILAAWLAPGVASACPMCSESIAGDPRLPQAYMTSILFMLATPAVLLGVFGGLVVRAIRAADAAHEPQLARVLARSGSIHPTEIMPGVILPQRDSRLS